MKEHRIAAQAEYNRLQHERAAHRIQAQLAHHERPQSGANRQANYLPSFLASQQAATIEDGGDLPACIEVTTPTIEQEAAHVRILDSARRRLLSFVAEVYQRDDAGDFVHLHGDGRIKRTGIQVPVSARSGVSQAERDAITSILAEIDRCGVWWLRYNERQRLYEVNLTLYPTVDLALDAISDTPTARR